MTLSHKRALFNHCLFFEAMTYVTIWFYFIFLIAENCSGYCTCSHCLEQPGCGWCTDPSNTGKGKCMDGSYRGALKMPTPSATGKQSLEPVLNVSMCAGEHNYNWSFIQCPGKWVKCSRVKCRVSSFIPVNGRRRRAWKTQKGTQFEMGRVDLSAEQLQRFATWRPAFKKCADVALKDIKL